MIAATEEARQWISNIEIVLRGEHGKENELPVLHRFSGWYFLW
jgi:hypothetical protein